MRTQANDCEFDSDEGPGVPAPDSVYARDCNVAGSDARAQTTLDFAVGMSLFLIVLLGALLFVSSTMGSFTDRSQANIGVADRVADSLSEGLLGHPADPHRVDGTCTAEFFADNSPATCRFDGQNLTSRVGVKYRRYVNVTMTSNLTTDDGEERLCWDRDDETIRHDGHGECDVSLAIGSNPPTSAGSTVTARRLVSIDGVDATLRVEVW